jgi:ATP-dependent Clp protease ATP-binding subunit ClpA
MDHGTLTDNNGRHVDFRNVILVMTTNAGAQESSRRSIGFSEQDNSTDMLEIVKKTFAPEFRNRLDAIVPFAPLGRESISRVVDKFLLELEEQLAAKQVALHVDDAARHWLGEHGYDEKMGARPMARVIQENVKRPLAEELLFGKLAHGGDVHITVRDDKLELELEAKEAAAATA